MSYQLIRNIYSDTSGNIGIGTLIPKSSLDISGSIAISNFINLSGTLIQKTQSGNLIITDISNNKLDGEYKNLLVSGNIDMSGNITCNNLTVNGTTTTIQSYVVTVEDPIIKLGGDISNNKDRGIEFTYYDTSNKKGFIGYNQATGNFTMLKDATNTNEVFTGTKGILEVGNIGIGTSAPVDSIDVRGNIVSSFNIGQYMGFNGYYNLGWRSIYGNTSVPSFVIRSDNNPTRTQFFCQPGSSVAYGGITVAERMCIKTDGNVGIGTSNPQAQLDVSNNVYIRGNVGVGTTNPLNSLHVELNSATSSTQVTCKNTNATGRAGIELSSGAASSFNIQSANGTGILENLAGSITFYAKGGGSYTFQNTNANSTRLVIANNGNVGIGGITSPAATLDISGNTNISGNVGIGLTNPQGILHITQNAKQTPAASGNMNTGVMISALSGSETINIGCAAGYNWIHSAYINNSGVTAPLSLQPIGGYVGIGITAPVRSLHGVGEFSWTPGTNNANTAFFNVHDTTASNGSNYDVVWRGLGSNGTIEVALNSFRIVATTYVYRIIGNKPSDNFHIDSPNGNIYLNYYNQTRTTYVSGPLAKASGTFDITHPTQPNKRLVHSFIEGPRCDLIYRGTVTLTNGKGLVNIDTDCVQSPECAMTEGTFVALCCNPQYFLQNTSGFDRVIGCMTGNILEITSENTNSNDTISWMVIAERQDAFIKQWNRTNQNGNLVTEYIPNPDELPKSPE